MLPEKEIEQIRDEIQSCKRPIFLFHDDPDGLCSFLLMYRFAGEGKGVVIKTTPNITTMFTRKVEEYGADKVFILDIAGVEQDFIDSVKVPVVWIDHHEPLKRERVKYFNPRIYGENIPPSRVCYEVTKKDIWISMAGCIGDWYMPHDIKDEFCSRYPHIMDSSIEKPEDALFNSKLGKLVKIMSFNLKGKTQDVMKSAKIFTRIKDPMEILEHSTPRGKFIYKRFESIKSEYDAILKKASSKKSKSSFLIFTYQEDRISLTKEVSNELLFRFPDKVIIIAREKSGLMKCSIRSGENVFLPEYLGKALAGFEGYGGGHEHACGAVVRKEDFKKFVLAFKKELKASGQIKD